MNSQLGEFEKDIIERLARIETKQDSIIEDTSKMGIKIECIEKRVNEHDLVIKAISKSGNWWLQVIGSGIGVLIGALLVSFVKGCI